MDKTVITKLGDFEVVRDVVADVATLMEPEAVYLYNQKLNTRGKFASFKLCVIGDFADKDEAERTIYLGVDSPLPFDLLLYTGEQWEEHSADPDSFAYRIKHTGVRVYG